MAQTTPTPAPVETTPTLQERINELGREPFTLLAKIIARIEAKRAQQAQEGGQG